jgi:RNA polymerase sigma-70 factor (ECF subfamily)
MSDAMRRDGGAIEGGDAARMRALDDRALVLALRAGDKRAIDELVERHRPWLLRQARRAGLAPDDADDVVIELLAHAAARLGDWRVRIPDSLAAWLAAALRNRIINARRGRGRLERALRDAADPDEAVVAGACSEATLRASRGPAWDPPAPPPELERLARALLDGLGEEERLLVLWDHHRIPRRTIAAWLGIGHEAAKQRIRRLRLRLRALARRHAATLPEQERRALARHLGATLIGADDTHDAPAAAMPAGREDDDDHG